MRKDFHSGQRAAQVFGPAAISADNTPAAIDLKGFDACELVLGVGIGGITFSASNKIEFVLTHSDDDDAYTPVADGDVLGVSGITGGIIKALVAAHAAAAHYRFGYIGGKRYLKLLADFSGTHGSATPLSAVAMLGRPAIAPVADQA